MRCLPVSPLAVSCARLDEVAQGVCRPRGGPGIARSPLRRDAGRGGAGDHAAHGLRGRAAARRSRAWCASALAAHTSDTVRGLAAFMIGQPAGLDLAARLAALRQDPSAGLALLHPLRAEPARYVQRSVANWINDAAKDHPDWPRDLCARWRAGSDAPATLGISARATRQAGARRRGCAPSGRSRPSGRPRSSGSAVQSLVSRCRGPGFSSSASTTP